MRMIEEVIRYPIYLASAFGIESFSVQLIKQFQCPCVPKPVFVSIVETPR